MQTGRDPSGPVSGTALCNAPLLALALRRRDLDRFLDGGDACRDFHRRADDNDYDLRMCPKFVTGESLRTLVSSIYREKLVGAIGLEPTTPTMSR